MFALRSLLLSWVLLCLSIGASAQAAPLDLTLDGPPSLVSGFIDVAYDSTTDVLGASGFALELDDDGVGAPEAIAGGTFALLAGVDAFGAFTAGGLSIGGTIGSLGFNSGTLLTGDITAFGFPGAGGDPLEFLVSVTGGDAAGLFGASFGLILSDSGFGGTFASNWDNIAGFPGTGTAVSNAAPLPEPTALLLLAVGLASAARRSRSAS